MSREPTPPNQSLLQSFEWHTPSRPEASHYNRLSSLLPCFASLGITHVWLPPGCKANNPQGNGYDIYDLWDLGEFEQKGTRATKWGSKEELDDLIATANHYSIQIVWDAVLNHKAGADGTEDVWVVEVDPEDRRYEICEPKKIEAWFRFDFAGRKQKGQGLKYSSLKWRSEHFNGTDWDHRWKKKAIYKSIDDPATAPKADNVELDQAVSNYSPRRDTLFWLRQRFRRSTKSPKLSTAPQKPRSPPWRRPGKGWADDVDVQKGNYDYLMFSNIDYTHTDVREDTLKWGKWMIEHVGVDGFRLDAVQHFSFNFTREWIRYVGSCYKERHGKDAFIVGEVWIGEADRIIKWLSAVQIPGGPRIHAYDAPLLYNFSRLSEDVRMQPKSADLREILKGSLLKNNPEAAVTLVTNHDTQPGQTSYTPMLAKLKPLFYAFILLRKEGLPCVSWGDLYGTKGPKSEPPACLESDGKGGNGSILPDLMLCRKLFAYGLQEDYFTDPHCIGFTRAGTHDRPGCAVVLSIGKAATKGMKIGVPGEVWVDLLDHAKHEITIDDRGFGGFACNGANVAVYVKKGVEGTDKFPVEFNLAVYADAGP